MNPIFISVAIEPGRWHGKTGQRRDDMRETNGLCAMGIVANPRSLEKGFMYQVVKNIVALWACGSWAWGCYSHQWLWLLLSVVPYLLFNSFGHLLDSSGSEVDATRFSDESEVDKNA